MLEDLFKDLGEMIVREDRVDTCADEPYDKISEEIAEEPKAVKFSWCWILFVLVVVIVLVFLFRR